MLWVRVEVVTSSVQQRLLVVVYNWFHKRRVDWNTGWGPIGRKTNVLGRSVRLGEIAPSDEFGPLVLRSTDARLVSHTRPALAVQMCLDQSRVDVTSAVKLHRKIARLHHLR